MDEITALLNDFYLISDMRIVLYDTHARCIAWAGPDTYSYCNAVHTTPCGLSRCFASDKEAFQIVKKTGKTHTYTCPFGLFEAATPLLLGDELLGYLLIGEAISADVAQRDFALREGIKFSDGSLDEGKFRSLIAQLPTHTREKQKALVNVLELLAAHIAASRDFSEPRANIAGLVKEHLERHYAKKLTLSELALHFHCSTVTLTTCFKKAFGTTIISYLTAKRVRAAAHLLLKTDLSVSAISVDCGFENPEHFSKVFKKETGLSPVHFRKANRKAPTTDCPFS